ncbi:aliphatic sulfonate ABC transporter substrate-binding protein [Sutcliffiella rhizosphaerae]|uniref:Aliphatic sulfonates-binding protein n=1 Tax=Sutcliffiella rhizosphaerae TaxID=2880967 RepID=A0ABM8YMI4_9BACI|nr:aliphatic sulfonate ABC transporter substrate-binding protein [Sutcliffiella rhizosphaerae]CAG9621208.1 Putative aliphatic sulfonates-binding protein [Sutcliffiella rhizosphaerae]
MKKFIWTFVVIASLLVVTACGNTGSAGGSTSGEKGKVIVGYQKGNTLNILKARGNLDERLKEEGYEVEWKVFAIGTALLEALHAGHIDFGHASDANSVFSQAGGKPIQYAASETPYPKGVALVAKSDSGLTTVQDLKGKTIGVTKGGNMHYLLLKALEKEGMEESDVDVVYYADAAEGSAAFSSDKIDVLGTWDPYLSIVESLFDTTTIVNGENLTDNRTFYFGSQEILDENPDLVKIILEELEESNQWANENKTEVAKILAEELSLDEKPLVTANERRDFGVLKVDENATKVQQDLADTFYKIELFPNAIQISDSVEANPNWLPEGLE